MRNSIKSLQIQYANKIIFLLPFLIDYDLFIYWILQFIHFFFNATRISHSNESTDKHAFAILLQLKLIYFNLNKISLNRILEGKRKIATFKLILLEFC